MSSTEVTPFERYKIISEEASLLAVKLIKDAQEKYKHPDAVVALALLQASIAMHKDANIITRLSFMRTAGEYWDNMVISNTGEPKK